MQESFWVWPILKYDKMEVNNIYMVCQPSRDSGCSALRVALNASTITERVKSVTIIYIPRFWIPYYVPHLCHILLPPNICTCLFNWYNPQYECTMGRVEMAAGVVQMELLAPRITFIYHTCNGCDNITAMRCTNRKSTSRSPIAGALLHNCALLMFRHSVSASIQYVPVDANYLANVASLCLVTIPS